MSTPRGSALGVIVVGMLLLVGCRGGSGPDSAPVPSTAATPASVSTDSTRPAGGSDTARLDEIDATLDRIERELDNDGGR